MAPANAAGGDVVEVGVGGLERLLVLLDERQLPERLAVVLAGADHAPDEPGVGAHHPGDARAQGAHDGARERRDVDDVGRPLLARAGQAVHQHQPALGVGVVDHHRLAVLGEEDVAGALGVRVRHVLGAAQHAHAP